MPHNVSGLCVVALRKKLNFNHDTLLGYYAKPLLCAVFLTVMDRINDLLQSLKQDGQDISQTSDGYHTFEELYEFRKVYNAALFNEWAKFDIPTYDVHKSWKHNDGELCFGGGWFIVVAVLPTGQISNHYEAKDWDLFKIPEVEKAKYQFDGHTSNDVLKRLSAL